jgi:20S proteasome subunit beta 3
MEYNGGSVVAMIGKDCVAIASDLRLGQQSIGVAMNFEKVHHPPESLYHALM